MIAEDFDAALAECLEETGVRRYEHLSSDANTLPAPNSAADYRRWILARGWRQGRVGVDYSPAVGGGCGACP